MSAGFPATLTGHVDLGRYSLRGGDGRSLNPVSGRTAFVLGGGGMLGAHEVGMLAALADAGIRPDLVLGTSIGAINGVFVAADPEAAASRLESVWRSDVVRGVFRSSIIGRIGTLARSGTH